MCALSEDIRYRHPNCSQIACCIFFLSISPLHHTRAVTGCLRGKRKGEQASAVVDTQTSALVCGLKSKFRAKFGRKGSVHALVTLMSAGQQGGGGGGGGAICDKNVSHDTHLAKTCLET